MAETAEAKVEKFQRDFGALNEEYQQKVAAFDKFLTSFKFLKPPGTETVAPKSTPKPTKKK